MGSPTIGTLSERSLHAALKEWYCQPGDVLEQEVDGFVIDIVRGAQLIEIQTRNFASIRRKLVYLLENHPVHLLHPIAVERWIIRQTENGREISRRKSPKKGRLVDVFAELISIPNIIMHPNLTMEMLLVREEIILRDDGRGSWRRKHWSVHDRRLLEVLETFILSSMADFKKLLPPDLVMPFTTRDLAESIGCNTAHSRKIAYALRRIGTIMVVGKRGNSVLYM